MTGAGDTERLLELLQRPGLARLRDRLRRRIERDIQGPLLTLADATEEERREIAGLLPQRDRLHDGGEVERRVGQRQDEDRHDDDGRAQRCAELLE